MRGMKGSSEGFALVAAILAIWVLTAVGVLVFTVSTQDIRVSGRMVGEKMAFSATETGIHQLTLGFNPSNLGASKTTSPQLADPGNDMGSRFTIDEPTIPSRGPSSIPIAGFAIAGGQQWGATRYLANVTGENTRYNSAVQISVGVGYGPVEQTTALR
jgi:hypothetical protein